ncbi:MAG: hypothetical protein Q8Q52_06810 [Acidimicrobiia bacterium]|nr:hypothetical protein [Acidimicrobiia bacterium]
MTARTTTGFGIQLYRLAPRIRLQSNRSWQEELGPGLDEDPAVCVIGNFDAHFGVGGGLVGRVGLGKGGGDVAQRCHKSLDVFFGEPGGGLAG